MLTTMFRRSPPNHSYFFTPKEGPAYEDDVPPEDTDDEAHTTLSRASTAERRPLLAHRDTAEDPTEISPLLTAGSRENGAGDYGGGQENGHSLDLEGQKHSSRRKWFGRTKDSFWDTEEGVARILPIIGNPKRWNRHALWENAVVAPVACLPAVVVGLLLNILDALSYGQYS
jgi:SulP family sulfate permease